MKNKIISLLALSLIAANTAFAEFSFVDPSDFTGDAFFESPLPKETSSGEEFSSKPSRTPSVPPLKKLRLKIKKKLSEHEARKSELAPVAPEENIYAAGTEVSEYASKDLKEEFDDTMMPDGFEADEEAIVENEKAKHFWQKKSKKENKAFEQDETESIVLDCDYINYDADNYCVLATGNATVNFVEQGTVVKADKLTYDRVNNTIKAEGNVRIIKNWQVITGEYIFVDMNEENALLEKPYTQTATIEMNAQKAYIYGDKIVQENGSMIVDKSFPIDYRTAGRGPRISSMLLPEQEILPNEKDDKILRLQVKDLKITQKGDLEILTLKKASFFKDKTKILKMPSVKIYTNKNFDFVESNSWEIGFLRGLGMYLGPGVVFEVPGGSVLKAMPVLNYNHGFGIGGVARYSSASNWTQAAYGTADSKFLIRGKQKLDDHLYLQYVMNDYLREWFLGRRRAKYGASLVYENGYSTKNFLLKNKRASFAHRVDLGYYHDSDYDSHYENLGSSGMGTTRARYMAQGLQTLASYTNKEKQIATSLSVLGQVSAAVYGTGDTQVIGRFGPTLHTQYKRWMQDIGYFHSAYEDNTPTPVFDAYRYGKSNVYVREYLRLNRYLTLSWFGSLNISGDAPNNERFQENSFFVSFGPDEVKFSLGYDFIRENTCFVVELMMDAKGSRLDFERMEIKQDKKAANKKQSEEENSSFKEAQKTPVLQRAVVEDVKILEDVL